MKKFFILFSVLFVSVLPALTGTMQADDLGKDSILVIRVSGVIDPVTSEFIQKSIDKANKSNCRALVITLDTPGGLETSMRSIVKNINVSDIPVVVYVYPSGARAASAGVFITMAGHIAAMSSGTNIGAAHPVGVGGKMDKTMKEKATNDAVAYIKSIAEQRGRNAEWAEEAVRKSVSVTGKEALELGIIDFVVDDIDELLKLIDNSKVIVNNREITIRTDNVNIETESMGTRLKILSMISNPNVAYVLMLLGMYGLFFELTNPGAVFPGVIGGISLILAFFAFQTLPVNYAGLLLIILAVVLFIMEATILSHGLLTIGGIISMFIGSLMLFDSPGPFFRVSIFMILPSVILSAIFFVVTVSLAVKAWKRKPETGIEGLTGLTGLAHTDIHDDGMVIVHGEYWSAWSDEIVEKGQRVKVVEVVGLRVKVKGVND